MTTLGRRATSIRACGKCLNSSKWGGCSSSSSMWCVCVCAQQQQQQQQQQQFVGIAVGGLYSGGRWRAADDDTGQAGDINKGLW
jgi:hypothetical protein